MKAGSWDVIVIGSGIGGLVTATQLAAKGVKVTILNDQYNEKKEPFKVRG